MAGAFDGKVVMITGANGNLGSAVAQHFGAAGASLALVVRRKGDSDDCAGFENCLTLEADVTDPDSVQQAVAGFVEHFGKIDMLVHTVGGYGGGKAVHDLDLAQWDKLMTLNARSFFVTGGTVAHQMLEAGQGGQIVVVLARHALEGRAKHAAYGAAKAATERVMQSMAKELLPQQIRVNAVVPGTIDTPQNRADMPNADFDTWVNPESIAAAIGFLCSPAAASISGASLPVYGRS